MNEPTFQRHTHDKKNPYVMISREMAQDKSISPKARGVLLYLLSLPDDWKIYHSQLCNGLGVGEDYVNSAMEELLNNGYAERTREKVKGLFQPYQYKIYEFKKCLPDRENRPGSTGPENPGIQKRDIENKQTEIVCVAAPPVAASPLVKIISLKTFDGKDITLSYQDLFDMCIKHRKNWTEKEVDELWKILENYKSPMRDLALFCDGTIKNMRKMKKIKEFEIKEKTCQTTTKTNENKNGSIEKLQNIKEKTSESVMWEQAFPNWREELGLPKRYPIG